MEDDRSPWEGEELWWEGLGRSLVCMPKGAEFLNAALSGRR